MAEERTIEVVEAELRNAKNEIAMQRSIIDDKQGGLDRVKRDVKHIQSLLEWFRNNYAYDTREAAVIELLQSMLSDVVDDVELSDIPF